MRAYQLKIGMIPYLVCAPFFHEIFQNLPVNWELIQGAPKHLNALLGNGIIDLAPSSSIEYAKQPDRYYILPDVCTSSTIEVRSVLLLSSFPIEELEGKFVTLTNASETSVALLKILFQKRFHIRVHFQYPSPNNSNRSDAELLIGDEALYAGYSKQRPYIYDLSTLWQKWQKLPFVFGCWIVQKKTWENAHGQKQVIKFHRTIKRSISSFPQKSNAALKIWIKKNHITLPDSLIKEYFQILDYRLTPEHVESLIRFYDLSYDCKLIEKSCKRPEILKL